MEYPGFDGFLGSRASFMLDVVFLAMLAVLPVMGWSIYQVKFRQRYLLHKRVQITLGIVLAVAVVLFEVDMRMHGWQERARGPDQQALSAAVWVALYIHLVFAISSALLWPLVIIRAIRQFPAPVGPGPHSRSHVFWGRLAAIGMCLTSITGWTFYLLAFV